MLSSTETAEVVSSVTVFWTAIYISLLAFVQNVSFSVVSRSRNRNNMRYHVIAACFSNGLWFLTFRELVLADMTIYLILPYIVGTVCGSVFGAKLSMFIEKLIGAEADGHIKKLDEDRVKEITKEVLENEILKTRNQL